MTSTPSALFTFESLKDRKVVLYGSAGSGKTTLARLIESKLNETTNEPKEVVVINENASLSLLKKEFMGRKTVLLSTSILPPPAIRRNTDYWIFCSPIQDDFPENVVNASVNIVPTKSAMVLWNLFTEPTFTMIETKISPVN